MTKIHNYEREIGEMSTNIKYIKKAVDGINSDVKLNTEFRNKATGVVAFLGVIAGFVGGGIVWILTKFWGDR